MPSSLAISIMLVQNKSRTKAEREVKEEYKCRQIASLINKRLVSINKKGDKAFSIFGRGRINMRELLKGDVKGQGDGKFNIGCDGRNPIRKAAVWILGEKFGKLHSGVRPQVWA